MRNILDYGCGDGACASIFTAKFKGGHLVGVDVSSGSIAEARKSNDAKEVSFFTMDEWRPDGRTDLVYTNGVFHHIKPSERMENLAAIRRALSQDGLFAFWENNPWNPGTRYVMSQCAFDEDAITISPREAREMLTQAGFTILRFDFLFFFPRPLRIFRSAERWLRGVPFGGQYQVLCKR